MQGRPGSAAVSPTRALRLPPTLLSEEAACGCASVKRGRKLKERTVSWGLQEWGTVEGGGAVGQRAGHRVTL